MKSAVVYWAKLPEHTDITRQGYVGFAVDHRRRWNYHRADARRGGKYTFARALRKHGSAITFEVVCVSSPEYCLELERKLRPVPGVGWNIGIGGTAAMLGRKHTAAAIAKMRESMKGLPKSEAARRAIGEAQRGRKVPAETCEKLSIAAKRRVVEKGFSAEHRANISLAKKGVPTGIAPWLHPQCDTGVWRRAAEIYPFFTQGVKSATLAWRLFGNRSKLKSMYRKFAEGWNPSADSNYAAWANKTIKD